MFNGSILCNCSRIVDLTDVRNFVLFTKGNCFAGIVDGRFIGQKQNPFLLLDLFQ